MTQRSCRALLVLLGHEGGGRSPWQGLGVPGRMLQLHPWKGFALRNTETKPKYIKVRLYISSIIFVWAGGGCPGHGGAQVPLNVVLAEAVLCCWQWRFFPKSVGNCLVLFLSPAVASHFSLITDFAVTFFQSVCCQVASIVFHGHSAQGCDTRDIN